MLTPLTYIGLQEHGNGLLGEAQAARRAAELHRPNRLTLARPPAARRRRATVMLAGAAAALALAVPLNVSAPVGTGQPPPTRHVSALIEVAQPAVLAKRASVTTTGLG